MLPYGDPRERRGALDSSMPRFPSQQLFILGTPVPDRKLHILAVREAAILRIMAPRVHC